jgi:hypothetical protein
MTIEMDGYEKKRNRPAKLGASIGDICGKFGLLATTHVLVVKTGIEVLRKKSKAL